MLLTALMAAPAPAAAYVKVNNVSYEKERHSVVLEISGPVTISTRSLKAPPRLVVDVPTATLFSPNQELMIQDALIKRVRVSQFQIVPPVVRVVIETATETEPLIAVQQTKNRLYITLAPARPLDKEAAPAAADPHDHGHAPAPRPTPADQQILPDASPAATPAKVEPRPTATPAVRRTAAPVATPSPAATPAPAPSIRPPARPGEKRGESSLETLPGMAP